MEKEMYKRQVQKLSHEKEQYQKSYEDLRRQYDEDISVIHSQLEQS